MQGDTLRHQRLKKKKNLGKVVWSLRQVVESAQMINES